MNKSHHLTKLHSLLLLALMLSLSYADDSIPYVRLSAPDAETDAFNNDVLTNNYDCLSAPSEIVPDSYIIIFDSPNVPPSFTSCIESLQGKITSDMDGTGMAIVSSSNPDFAKEAAKIEGVLAVAPDRKVQWIDPDWSKKVVRLP